MGDLGQDEEFPSCSFLGMNRCQHLSRVKNVKFKCVWDVVRLDPYFRFNGLLWDVCIQWPQDDMLYKYGGGRIVLLGLCVSFTLLSSWSGCCWTPSRLDLWTYLFFYSALSFFFPSVQFLEVPFPGAYTYNCCILRVEPPVTKSFCPWWLCVFWHTNRFFKLSGLAPASTHWALLVSLQKETQF